MSLIHAGPLPLYAQLREALQREIETVMKPGDALPTEAELGQRFGVSRITIRRAMDELVAEGLVVRQQGRGTFVRKPPITQELTELLSWTSAMRRLGFSPETMRCEIDVIEPPRAIGAMLNLAPGERVVRVRRLRGAAGGVICIMSNYVPASLLPDLPRTGLRDDSLYATLLAHDLRPARIEDTVEARPATTAEAELLQIDPGSPLLQITRLSSDATGRPLDVAVVSSRADRYRYSVRYTARAGKDLLPVASPITEAR